MGDDPCCGKFYIFGGAAFLAYHHEVVWEPLSVTM